jgi:hypothetical protein
MRSLALLLVAACGVNQTPQPEPPPALPSCVPDRDGVITAEEMPVALDLRAPYYVGKDAPVALGGNEQWDLAEERAADEVIDVGPVPLSERSYAANFPGASFVADVGEEIESVLHQDAEGLWLHGTASRDQTAANATFVRYAEPIAILRFPIALGDAFTVTAQIVDSTIEGLPFVGTDDVSVAVDGSGRLDLPYVRFSPALRVRTTVERKPSTGTPIVRRRATSFLFECLGEVAHADSRIDEPNDDFTTAATLRRFALGVTP